MEQPGVVCGSFHDSLLDLTLIIIMDLTVLRQRKTVGICGKCLCGDIFKVVKKVNNNLLRMMYNMYMIPRRGIGVSVSKFDFQAQFG